jgi:predicted anti-sigma-YlaC factor YlaD
MRPSRLCLCLGTPLLALFGACRSVRNVALDQVGDALAGSSKAWANDADPELIRDAAPFSLKLIESLVEQRPEHVGLRLAAASGFTQYAYAFVEQDADRIESESFARAEELRTRARKLYVRARDHGLAAMETLHPGIGARLHADPAAAVRAFELEQVALLYWCAAPWGASIALSKDDPDAIGELPIVEALFTRALALDETWNDGALVSAWIGLESVRAGAGADALARAEQRYVRAVELARGRLASPHVAYAEKVCVQRQDAAGFRQALAKALAIDVDAAPEQRLANVLAQRRARWLLSRQDDLILAQEP